ncbi:SHOCT domain-containing protein [Haloarcula nitratireducens]|uniref:SHOCT domain-containing protein n=1 Tax=Haloarcula nitratireducens TaxID=2487749 RepID=A0AAW4PAY2_9EURY|nr:SHOCT domain-containing protein [Halomicroarcula nitratireducens]MBX0295064.1 SHOCT domain-containing protein [Halomicroarcula nitratireducens]
MQNPLRTRGTRSLAIVVLGALALAVAAGGILTRATVPRPEILWPTLVVGLSVAALYWLLARSRAERRDEDGALAVLREQYARDEIDDEEFERRRARLAPNR